MAEETLLEWAKDQPDWAQDALRRHAISVQTPISESDRAAIIERVRYHSGFAVELRCSRKIGQLVKLGSPQKEDEPDDGHTETVQCGFQSESCS
jgi:hypothetical protein